MPQGGWYLIGNILIEVWVELPWWSWCSRLSVGVPSPETSASIPATT